MSLNNFLPAAPGRTPGYWCTWGAQGVALELDKTVSAFGLEGHLRNVEVLTEANLFGENGWVTSDYFAAIKPDLYVVYDVGWDVPLVQNLAGHDWKDYLGSMVLAEDKFPSCTGSPAERLRRLNQMTQAAGWRGAGLWLHAQTAPLAMGKTDPSMAEMEAYFRERARWCREAGIEYWKVDYGQYCADLDFRSMLTRVAREEYPVLVVEHARNGGPFNDQYCPWDTASLNNTGTFRAWGNGQVLAVSVETMKFSEVFRAYDLSYKLTTPTMLDRIAQLLAEFSNQPNHPCILNCEDEPYIGAALGCAIGIMHSSLEPAEKRGNHIRAIRWQRIAPPFGAGLSENRIDEEMLENSWRFQPGDDWVDWMNGQVVSQLAPARISRDMPLPEVHCAGEPPFVLASRFPSGAVAVAALGRVSAEQGAYFPLADVSVEIEDTAAPIGVFGRFNSLTLQFSEDPDGRQILAQDLAGEEPVDISAQVAVHELKVVIPGELIEQIGRSVITGPADESEPGLILLIR